MEAAAGETAMETSSGAVTCIAALALEPDKDAEMVAVPAAPAAETEPEAETCATAGSLDAHAICAVMSCALPSEKVPCADSDAAIPNGRLSGEGEIAMEASVAGVTETAALACRPEIDAVTL